MYKSILVVALLCGVASCAAYPYPFPQNAFMYYRSAYPMMAYPQLQQSAMYQHAMYQNQRLRNFRRSASSGVAAFAAGDEIATGTQLVRDPAFPAVQSFAEAYPAEAVPENEIPAADEGGLLEPESTAGTELDFPIDDEGSQEGAYGALAPVAPVPLADPVVPQSSVTDKRKKKVTVQLDSASAEEDQDDQADELSFGTRRGGSGRPATAGSAGPMFPVTFGSTNGGAIAIANSYSTGKGGSATSHATAYGSPASVPEERRRSVVVQQQSQLQSRNSRPAKLRNKY